MTFSLRIGERLYGIQAQSHDRFPALNARLCIPLPPPCTLIFLSLLPRSLSPTLLIVCVRARACAQPL